MEKRRDGVSRRNFLRAAGVTAAAAGFPAIVPSSVLGQLAPSKRINVGAIGAGRISRVHDMPAILQYDDARIVAVCDLDAKRVADGKKFVEAMQFGDPEEAQRLFDEEVNKRVNQHTR